MNLENYRNFYYFKEEELKNNSNLFLIMRLELDSVSIFVKDQKTKIIVYATSFKFENIDFFQFLPNIISQDIIFRYNIAYAKILLPSIGHTLVPKNIFQIEDAKTYLKINIEENIINNSIINISYINDIAGIFLINKEILTLTNKILPNYQSSPYSFEFLSLTEKYNFTYSNNQVSILVDNNYFDLAIYKKNNLFLFNRFSCRNNEEIAYFTLKSIKELDILPEDTNVSLFGNVPLDTNLIEILNNFVGFVDLNKHEPDSTYNWDLHKFYVEEKL